MALDGKETYGLARLLAKVDERDVSPEQSRPALLLAQNVLRHLVALVDHAEAAERRKVASLAGGGDDLGDVGGGASLGGGGDVGSVVAGPHSSGPTHAVSMTQTDVVRHQSSREEELSGNVHGRGHGCDGGAHTAASPPTTTVGGGSNAATLSRALPAASDGKAVQSRAGGLGPQLEPGDLRDPTSADTAGDAATSSSLEAEQLFRAKCMQGIQDVLVVNRGLEEQLRLEHGLRVKAEADVDNLKRELSLVGTGGSHRLVGLGDSGGGGGGQLVHDFSVLPGLNRAATVIQRRQRGMMGRRQGRVHEYRRKGMVGDEMDVSFVPSAADEDISRSPPLSSRGGGAGSRGAARRRAQAGAAGNVSGRVRVAGDITDSAGSSGGSEGGGQSTMAAMCCRVRQIEAALRMVESRHAREMEEARTEVCYLQETNAALLDANQQLPTLSATHVQLERERVARKEAERALRATFPVEAKAGTNAGAGAGGVEELVQVDYSLGHVSPSHNPSARWVTPTDSGE